MTQEQICFRVALFKAFIRGSGAALIVLLAVNYLYKPMMPFLFRLFPQNEFEVGEIIWNAAHNVIFVSKIILLAFLVGVIDELESAHTKLKMECGEISKPPCMIIQGMNAVMLLIPIFWLYSFGITINLDSLFLASAYHFLIVLLAMSFMAMILQYLFPN